MHIRELKSLVLRILGPSDNKHISHFASAEVTGSETIWVHAPNGTKRPYWPSRNKRSGLCVMEWEQGPLATHTDRICFTSHDAEGKI